MMRSSIPDDDDRRALLALLDRLAHIEKGIMSLNRSHSKLIEILEKLVRELDKALKEKS